MKVTIDRESAQPVGWRVEPSCFRIHTPGDDCYNGRDHSFDETMLQVESYADFIVQQPLTCHELDPRTSRPVPSPLKMGTAGFGVVGYRSKELAKPS